MVGHRTAEDVGHPAVADHHAQEGQQEAEEGQSHAVRVVIQGAFRRTEIVAHCAVALDSSRGKVKSRCAEEEDNQPHPCADAPRHPAAAFFVPHSEGVANPNVAVHTDAGEEEDAAMQITEIGKQTGQ